MNVSRTLVVACLFLLAAPAAALADTLGGKITDKSGAVLPGASVRVTNIASGEQRSVLADANGRYTIDQLAPGTFLVAAAHPGFSEASRTIVLTAAHTTTTADFVLEIGSLSFPVDVTAMRGARDPGVIPLRTDTLTSDTLKRAVPVSTGDALVLAPGVTPVGNGPFQVRPRLRGLDSTRVLVLIDGERLNNARTATDRAGVEVGLVAVDTIEELEVLGGAGSVLYGTDALAGTINIITNRARYSSSRQFNMGFDGMYSSNENGRRGTVLLGVSDRRWAVSFMGGSEQFDAYHSGKDFEETSVPFFTDGTLRQADTIDDNFGFTFRAFPESFNAPFTRTSDLVPRSGSSASTINLSAVALLRSSQELQVRYQRRHASDIGFPDFEQPYFFQSIALPWSNLDKFSASYAFTDVTPWLKRLSASTYLQRQDRQLRNNVPVQFPAPTAVAFFPINVFQLDILSETRQQVWTPGLDVQANMQLRPGNVLTAGMTLFRDRSEDERTTTTQMSLIGNVALGARGPAATVFPQPVALGGPSTESPVRVPDASFRDLALFVQDEWAISPMVRLSGGLRVDGYRVTTDPTPGYDVASLVAGAVPPIDPATLPDVAGERISRTAMTGEAGIVVAVSRPVSLFAHYVRSYRHPNLEELLFSGPATTGNIVPNIGVEPETGHNVDIGAKFRVANATGSVGYFVNRYANFISTEEVADSPEGSISQAMNLAAVRIQGLEAAGETQFVAGGLTWSPQASLAWTSGTVLSGTTPLTGLSLDGEPQDNISPFKFAGTLRVGDRSDRWWAAYGVRSMAKISRVSPLLSESPFLIAQDLLGLDGFAVQRVAGGYNWRAGGQHLGLTLTVDNLTDRFYREQFQFAPARGRSVTLSVNVRGVK